MGTVFSAKYGGRCGNCDEMFSPGEPMTFDNDTLVHELCAGTEAVQHAIDGMVAPDRTQPTMPRGRHVSDRCGSCFQIPSSSGACGCQ